MEKTQDLTNGDITSQLLAMAIPMIATSFIQTAYSLIDMIWIGRLGSSAVASVGTASFLINMSVAIFTIIATGTSIKISHRFGAKDYGPIKAYIVNGRIIALLIALVYAALMIVFKHEVIGFFKINDPLIQLHAEKYLVISMLATPFMFLNTLYTSTFNSFGNSKLSFKLNTVGLALNIILDPLFIFGVNGFMALGVSGAAYASIIGRIVVFILYVYQSRDMETFQNLRYKIDIERLKEVLKLGFPNMIQRVSFIAIAMMMARLISSFGATGIAVQKIGLQVESISYMTIGGLYGAVSIFIGQNFGVKNIARIRSGYKRALLISSAFGLTTTLLFIIFAKPIFMLFVSDKETIALGVNYLQIIGLSQMFMCIEIVTMASFNGVGKTYIPAAVSLTFTSLRIPIAYILSKQLMMGLNGVWWSISATSMIKGLLLVTLFLIFLYKKNNMFESEGANA